MQYYVGGTRRLCEEEETGVNIFAHIPPNLNKNSDRGISCLYVN